MGNNVTLSDGDLENLQNDFFGIFHLSYLDFCKANLIDQPKDDMIDKAIDITVKREINKRRIKGSLIGLSILALVGCTKIEPDTVIEKNIGKLNIEEVNDEELSQYAKSINAVYKQTSALQSTGINDLFDMIGHKILTSGKYPEIMKKNSESHIKLEQLEGEASSDSRTNGKRRKTT